MALPEYSLRDDFVLTPADVTSETMEMFGRHVQQTEKNMLRDVFRENIRIETPFQTTGGDEAAIFAAIFDEDV